MNSQSLLSLSAWLLAALAVPLTAGSRRTPSNYIQLQYTSPDLGTLDGGTFSQPFLMTGMVLGKCSATSPTVHRTPSLAHGQIQDIGTPRARRPNSIAFVDNESSRAVGEAELPLRSQWEISADSYPPLPVYLSCGQGRGMIQSRHSVATTRG